jgi:hypothetical protein
MTCNLTTYRSALSLVAFLTITVAHVPGDEVAPRRRVDVTDTVAQIAQQTANPQSPTREATSAAGEDIGASPGTAELLTDLQRDMREAANRIEAEDTSDKTQNLQQQVIDGLSALIDELEDRGKSGGSTKQPSAAAQASAGQTPSESTATQRTATGDEPNVDGSDAEREDDPFGDQFLSEVWGQLPAEVKTQIQSPLREQFLPAYEQLIIDYYRRLAEGESQ